jgi:hypothetical protein
MVIVSLLSGCKGCGPDDILKQLNNGNTNPELLYIELFGTEIANTIELGFGAGCDHPKNFSATVEIIVRTASLINGNLVPDPRPYFEYDQDKVMFWANTGYNEGTVFKVNVPESGAFGIFIEIEIDNCTICCHGELDGQCGLEVANSNGVWYCEAGKAQVTIESVFWGDKRPEHNFNWQPYDKIFVKDCRACGCYVLCN